MGAWGQVPESGSTVTGDRLEVPQPHQPLRKPDHFPKLGGGSRRQQDGKGLRSPPKIDPCLAHTHSLPLACPTGRLAGMRSGWKSAARNTQLSPSASEDLEFQSAAWHTGVWERQEHLGAEGREGIPETCSLQCPDAEPYTQFFSELVLGGQGILGGSFSCQVVSSVVRTGVLVSGPRDDELPSNDNETLYRNKTTKQTPMC